MKKYFSKGTAMLLAVLMVLGSINMPTYDVHAANGVVSEYVNEGFDDPDAPWYQQNEPRFYITNEHGTGILAMCCKFQQSIPTKNSVVSSPVLVTDDRMRRVLYYGFGGPGYKEEWKHTLGLGWSVTAYMASEVNGDDGERHQLKGFYENCIGRFNYPAPPSNFKVYMVQARPGELGTNPKGVHNVPYQQLVYAVIEPELGNVSLSKVSANPSVTSGNNNYSLQGATFTLSGADYSVTKTTDANGRCSWTDVPQGTYTLVENSPSKGYKVVSSRNITVTAGNTINVTVEEPFDIGYIELQKQYDKTCITANNNAYSLAGAVYNVTNANNNVVGTITTDARGYGRIDNIPLGAYTIREVTPSKGCVIDVTPHNVTITSTSLGARVNSIEPVKYDPIDLHIYKHDASTPNGRVMGDASLADAVFKFEYIPSGATEPTISFTSKTVQTDDGVGDIYLDKDSVISDFRSTNGVKLDDLWDEYGRLSFGIGQFNITELEPPKGYTLENTQMKLHETSEWSNGVTYTINITDNGSTSVRILNDANGELIVKEQSVHGGFAISKVDADSRKAEPQGDAVDMTASFEVINKSDSAIVVNGATYMKDAVCFRFTTDANGEYTSANDLLPYGSYEIREVVAPVGYVLDEAWSTSFRIINDKEIVRPDGYVVTNDVIRGGVRGVKIDSEFNQSTPQGDARLDGAVYEIRNNSDHKVFVNNNWYDKGEVCARMTTNANGEFSFNGLPYGSYTVYEGEPSVGYKLNTTWKYDFTIRTDGEIKDCTSTPCTEDVIRGDVQITKLDRELGESIALGGADLSGIGFVITNISPNHVKVNGTEVSPNGVAAMIYTQWDEEAGAYIAKTTDGALPYGTYTISEVVTNNTYLLTDGTRYVFEIRNDGEVVTASKSGVDPMTFSNYVVRGDIEFRKIANMTSKRMHTLWTLTNNDTGEVHVISSDVNGEYYSSASFVPHSYQTNANDVLLDKINAGDVINMADVIANAGTWFGMSSDGSVAPVSDVYSDNYIYNAHYYNEIGAVGLTGTNGTVVSQEPAGVGANALVGALPYGNYTLQEVRTDSNEGYTLQHFDFNIYRHGYVVDLGTIEDYEISITTEALDDSTGEHIGIADGTVVIVDTISYEGVIKGDTYVIEGQLMDRATGAVVTYTDESGNIMPVVASTEFVATGTKGSTTLTFTVDADVVRDKTVVAFETLFDNNGYMLCSEADISNEAQTVYFPDVETELTYEGEHDVPSTGTIKLVDTVSYSNLIPNKKYRLNGVLMDKDEHDNILDARGREITASVEFVPTEPNGVVEVEFEVDASILVGKMTVAFETLVYRNMDIAIHADINDDDQTVYSPVISTEAKAVVTGTHEAPAVEDLVIVDTVSYDNVVIGNTYTMVGTLMNKATGEPVVDDNGDVITKSVTFTATAHSGSVDVEFIVDASTFAGMQTVFFEKLVRGSIEYASHEDIEDLGQTVVFPKLVTRATYGDTDINEGIAVADVTIIDTVDYENLTIGETYTLVGMLIDKESGIALSDEDGVITVTKDFVPESATGSVDMEFTIDATELAGRTLVVFESCIHNDVEIAVHADIDDDNQSIHFPSIETELTDEHEIHEAISSDVTLIDTVEYKNLTVGETYTMVGTLMDKATGEPMVDDDGDVITASVEFVPTEPNGVATVTFEFKGVTLAGKTVVAYEHCYRDEIEVAVHTDIEDDDQTVKFPSIRTLAKRGSADITDEDYNIVYVATDTVIVDEVTYSNVTVGNEYVVEGILIDKATGEPIVDANGDTYTSSVTFEASSDTGFLDLEFVVDSTSLIGKSIVMYDRLYRVIDEDNVLLYIDEDIDNADETVIVAEPVIGTTAIGKNTSSHLLDRGDTTVVIDTIEYTNLNPNTTYKVVGTLVDKATGDVVSDTVETEFVATAVNGSVDVSFTIDTIALVGKTLVAFEKLYINDTVIAEHEDINAESQTVYVASITTVATTSDGRSKVIPVADSVKIIDKITYTNLIPNKTYTVAGSVAKQSDGRLICEPVIVTFVPTDTKGSVEVEYNVNTLGLDNGTVLVCQEVVMDEYTNIIALEDDLSNADQSVVVETTTIIITGIQTYGSVMAIGAVIMLLGVIATIIAMISIKRRRLMA